MSNNFLKFTLAFGVPLLLALYVCFGGIFFEDSYSDYYGSNRLSLSSAPNGIYEVWIMEIEVEKGLVWFPLCPSYGGVLHGVWRYDFENVSFVTNRWYEVWLRDNVVVCARESV